MLLLHRFQLPLQLREHIGQLVLKLLLLFFESLPRFPLYAFNNGSQLMHFFLAVVHFYVQGVLNLKDLVTNFSVDGRLKLISELRELGLRGLAVLLQVFVEA